MSTLVWGGRHGSEGFQISRELQLTVISERPLCPPLTLGKTQSIGERWGRGVVPCSQLCGCHLWDPPRARQCDQWGPGFPGPCPCADLLLPPWTDNCVCFAKQPLILLLCVNMSTSPCFKDPCPGLCPTVPPAASWVSGTGSSKPDG